MGKKLFNYVIGNPPYQDETLGDNKGFAPPVYDKFLDAAYEIADKVEMIHPARFLFDAGSTPKAWNKKMLSDEHFKVLEYEADASSVFPGIDIKGGVAITYHDHTKDYGVIGIFTRMMKLIALCKKSGTHLQRGRLVISGCLVTHITSLSCCIRKTREYCKRRLLLKGKKVL